jgi:hypothetical protein
MFYELLKQSLSTTEIEINYTVDAVFKKVYDSINIIQAH